MLQLEREYDASKKKKENVTPVYYFTSYPGNIFGSLGEEINLCFSFVPWNRRFAYGTDQNGFILTIK